MDTPTPFLQLSGTIFQGTHQSLLGTELLLTEDKGSSRGSIVFARYKHHSHQQSGLDDQTRRKVTHLANTSQRIRFKQVEVRPKDESPDPPPGASTRGKGKGARSKQKSNAVSDDNIVDLITGNVDAGDVPPQRRRGGKEKVKRGDGSRPSQQPGNVEQEAAPEETSSTPGLAMES